jgi:hypothetical protein
MLLYRVDGDFTQGLVEHGVMNYQVGHVLLKKFEAFTEAVDFAIQAFLSLACAMRRRDVPRKRYEPLRRMN